MEHLKEFNEFGGSVSKELQDLLKDILLEVEDDGYDVTYQWHTTQDNLPYILIEPKGMGFAYGLSVDGVDYDKIRDTVERVFEVGKDYGWKFDVDAMASYYMLIFIQ
jgi:hypothetical protein